MTAAVPVLAGDQPLSPALGAVAGGQDLEFELPLDLLDAPALLPVGLIPLSSDTLRLHASDFQSREPVLIVDTCG